MVRANDDQNSDQYGLPDKSRLDASREPHHYGDISSFSDKPAGTVPETGSTNLATLQQIGQMELPEPKSNIHVLNIIGQIEGHLVLPLKIKQVSMSI